MSTAPLDNGDIVARDKNGCYQVDIPIMPSGVFGEDPDGRNAMEGIQQNGGMSEIMGDGISGTDKESTLLLVLPSDLSFLDEECANHS